MSLELISSHLDASFLNDCLIEAIIGQGLDGEIVRFSKKKDNTKGVLKIPRHDLTHEIEILSKLIPHQNIVTFNGVQRTKRGEGILLEHLEGQDLFSMLEEENNLYESIAKDILRQILTAIKSIHSQNIVHRDIKLENIFVSPKCSVKLLDFGLSETISDDISLTELSGTPSYIAPEMINKALNPSMNGYGRPVDIWACGVLLYAMISGSFPFWHEKQFRRYQLILEGEIDLSDGGWEDVSEKAKSLIRSLLTLDPSIRPSASEALNHCWFN
ncbi:Phosphorylase b kinase gamma catalytic chain, skeletal muscle/heart isoform [Oopsacas minuta]|uniref:Phosphorylase b kinase gamma catalytic chain, skeletal muscle/heart isoform n=1 Tax=Oopsacas minuta TaxID=111878 RepID=A0AAV7K073_9METZ|nr:Phosphorylase b kinase gamma catalytic chain, skeletal muscle/heart isoform [Oopsacas minuta]